MITFMVANIHKDFCLSVIQVPHLQQVPVVTSGEQFMQGVTSQGMPSLGVQQTVNAPSPVLLARPSPTVTPNVTPRAQVSYTVSTPPSINTPTPPPSNRVSPLANPALQNSALDLSPKKVKAKTVSDIIKEAEGNSQQLTYASDGSLDLSVNKRAERNTEELSMEGQSEQDSSEMESNAPMDLSVPRGAQQGNSYGEENQEYKNIADAAIGTRTCIDTGIGALVATTALPRQCGLGCCRGHGDSGGGRADIDITDAGKRAAACQLSRRSESAREH